jgi:hypothetical protein
MFVILFGIAHVTMRLIKENNVTERLLAWSTLR